jgi:hypothetical protein
MNGLFSSRKQKTAWHHQAVSVIFLASKI